MLGNTCLLKFIDYKIINVELVLPNQTALLTTMLKTGSLR